MRRPVKRAAAVSALLLLSGCGAAVLNPQGPVGGAERTILLNALTIMAAIVVPTIMVTLLFAWWFRASNTKARYLPDFVYSGRLELIVWSIPILTITFLGGLIWIGSHQLDPAKPLASPVKPVEVEVVSLDWKWLFIYPQEGIASVNQLVVPAGAPVHFQLTAASVMNVFFVPQLGSEIYTMNGMVTQLNLMADHPGSYYGQSAHFSGDGFPDMNFQMRAVSPQDYAAWVTAAKGSGPALDLQSYGGLLQQSQAVKPYTYRTVQPTLFQAIASGAAPTGAGPTTGSPTPSVSPRKQG